MMIFETYHHNDNDNGKFDAFFIFWFFSFGAKAFTVCLVLCVFFKEIWLKLNYVKIFRQNFCILYSHEHCIHILSVTRQYHLVSSRLVFVLSRHWIAFSIDFFFSYLFCIWFLSTTKMKSEKNNNDDDDDWNTCKAQCYVCVCILVLEFLSKIYLHTNFKQAQKKQIDWYKSMHVFCDSLLLCCSCDRHFVCAHVYWYSWLWLWQRMCMCISDKAAHFMQIGQFESKFTLFTIKYSILNMQIPTDIQVAT